MLIVGSSHTDSRIIRKSQRNYGFKAGNEILFLRNIIWRFDSKNVCQECCEHSRLDIVQNILIKFQCMLILGFRAAK